MPRPRLAEHKFASCDGCQLAFLNAGEALLALAQRAEIVHFAEAGWHAPLEKVDIALVEGSISTPQDLERVRAVREAAKFLVAIGACATAGGLQALRNGLDESAGWLAEIYASPQYIESLPESRPLSAHVKVDLELWGCRRDTGDVVSHHEVKREKTLVYASGTVRLEPLAPELRGRPPLGGREVGEVFALTGKGERTSGVRRTWSGPTAETSYTPCSPDPSPPDLPIQATHAAGT